VRAGEHRALGGEISVHDDQIERLAHDPAVAGDAHAPVVAAVRVGEDGHSVAPPQGLLGETLDVVLAAARIGSVPMHDEQQLAHPVCIARAGVYHSAGPCRLRGRDIGAHRGL